ncbi:DUF6912 family protein [Brachybacterium sp. DNPG3]
MRIFLPLTDEERPALTGIAPELLIAPGRAAWAVTAAARADHPEEDTEELEYDALQDAVHVALVTGSRDARALVIAADVPDSDIGGAEDTGGAYGVVTVSETLARVAALHVTELDAAAADADDTDPALLWFDASEGAEAIAYLDERTQG